MPNADQGTVTADAENAIPPTKEADAGPLPGFAEAMVGFGNELPGESGEPEEAKAVETSAEDKAPAAEKSETPEPPEAKAPDKAEDKPDPAKSVNFDGFSDKQRTTYERLLKAGHVTPEEFEEAKRGFLRQDLFSKKTTALAREREEFESSMKDRKDDLALLDRIRGSETLHAAWMRMSRGDVAADEADADPADSESVERLVDKRIEAREREREARTRQQQVEYDKKKGAMQTALRESQQTLGIDSEAMIAYLKAEEATLPDGADPITSMNPSELVRRIELAHVAAQAKAEAAKWREQSSQRTSQATRNAKQSLPPPRRVTAEAPRRGIGKVLADLGVARLSDVQGAGFAGD